MKTDETTNEGPTDLQFVPVIKPPVVVSLYRKSSYRYGDCIKRNHCFFKVIFLNSTFIYLYRSRRRIKDFYDTELFKFETSENKVGIQTECFVSNFVTANSELTSPEGLTVSLSSATSKESPGSPSFVSESSEKTLKNIDTPTSRLNSVEPIAHNEEEGATQNQWYSFNLFRFLRDIYF